MITTTAWMLRQAHPVRMLLSPWQSGVFSGPGLSAEAAFLAHPSVDDLRTIRSPGAPVATALRHSWRGAGRLTRFFLRHFGHLLAAEHVVLWSDGLGDDEDRVPLISSLGGSRSTIIPMPTGPRLGIDSAKTFVKFPLAESEARGISTEVDNTNRAAEYYWSGYATPWAERGELGGLRFARFPHIDDHVASLDVMSRDVVSATRP